MILTTDCANKARQSICMQNTPETILLLSESPYRYNWKRKTFTPIHINHLKDAIVGQVLYPICVKETFSYLHHSKCIYRIDHNDNTLHVLYHCKQDTMIHSASADEKGIIWIGGLQWQFLGPMTVHILIFQTR